MTHSQNMRQKINKVAFVFFTKMTRREKKTTLIQKGHVEFQKNKHVPIIHSPDLQF